MKRNIYFSILKIKYGLKANEINFAETSEMLLFNNVWNIKINYCKMNLKKTHFTLFKPRIAMNNSITFPLTFNILLTALLRNVTFQHSSERFIALF